MPSNSMVSFKTFLVLLALLIISGNAHAQHDSIFTTPFPRQITVLDSALIMLAKVDSATLYNGIEKLKAAATNVDD